MVIYCSQDYRPVSMKSCSDLMLSVLFQLHGNLITLLEVVNMLLDI